MLIWTPIIFALFTISVISNHPLQDDSDPELVEARRTQVLSGSTQHYHHHQEEEEQNDEDEIKIEKDGVAGGGGRSSSRGQTRHKYTYQRNAQDRKDDVEEDEDEEDEKEKVLSEENNSKNRSKNYRTRSKVEEGQVESTNDRGEKQSSKTTSNASIESKSNKTFDDSSDDKDETDFQVSPSPSTSSSSQKQKTVSDSHKNYTRLEPVRGRKSSSSSTSSTLNSGSSSPPSTFRRQRTPSHVQTDVTTETSDIVSESTQNSKKRRRLLTTSTSTTPTPQTMPYNLYNHFRPLEQDVPQDHLLPFLDFGKKLSPGIPPTPSGINSIESKSINNNNNLRHRSKENVTPEYRSTSLDEDVLLHEDMDVTVQKKTIERNNIPRVKIQQLRDPYISGYYRRRPSTTSTSTSTTVQPSQSTTASKNSDNIEIPSRDCNGVRTKQINDSEKTNSDSEKSGTSLYYKHNSRTIMNNNVTKCDYIDDNISTTTLKYNNDKLLRTDNQHVNEKLLTRDITKDFASATLNNGKLYDVEDIKNSSPNSRLQKFERMKVEPSSPVTPSLETTTPNILSTTKRTLPIKLHLRNRNTTSTRNDTAITTTKNYEQPKSTIDPLIHEESNNYEKTMNTSQEQRPKKQPIITTTSPSGQQLTTRILSTAVVTSVSVKESVPKNDNPDGQNNETEHSFIATNITGTQINSENLIKNTNNQETLNQNENITKTLRKTGDLVTDDGKSSNKTIHLDSMVSDSSTKVIVKPTESTLSNNRTVPEDFIEVPRVMTKNPSTTTASTTSTENNRKESNKTVINPLYKPKIILPRTKVIVSTTPRATSNVPLTKNTRIPTMKTKLEEKVSSKENISSVQSTPTDIQTRTTINTKELTIPSSMSRTTSNDSVIYSTDNLETTTTPMPTIETLVTKLNNDELGNKNPIALSTSSYNSYNVTEDNSETNNRKQHVLEDESKINEEVMIKKDEKIDNESSRRGDTNLDDSVSLHGDISRNPPDYETDPSRSRVEPSKEIDSSKNDDSQSDKPSETNLQEKDKVSSGVSENDDKNIPAATESIPDKVLEVAVATARNKPTTSTTYPTVLPPLSTSASALDHKWMHSSGKKHDHNVSVTDGQHTDVGVAYPEGVHVATYVLTGLGIIPILLLAVIVARVFVLRNRKKVLDESEYSSEYNRSPLGTTSSPLPTKLPRVPAHLGWEVEKNPPLPPIPVTSTRWEFPRDKLRLQTVLGQGNFGQVWKAEADDISGHEGLTRLVAVKTVKEGASNREREDLLRELGIMQELGSHPNVVTLLGCCTEKEPYLLIMEYVMYGKLLAFLRDHRTRAHYYNFSESTDALTSRDLTVFAYCVARGMDYLTTKGIIHRDIAARNVLVDHNKLCKIADFGMSRNVRDTGQIYEQRQSKGALPIRWMAPESLHFSLFTHKTDVWSFGILMWEIVTLGSTPYANMGAREVMRRVREGYRLERPAHCHQELFRVIQRCWHSEPAKRPTFAELKHELGQLLGDSEHGGGYVDLDSLAEEIKHHNHSEASTLQRPHNH